MSAIALIACSASKRETSAPARELYTGALFRAAVLYAESRHLPWFVLSAKHWVVRPNQIIYPYDVALGKLRLQPGNERCTEKELAAQWVNHVRRMLMVGDEPIVRRGDTVVMLAGATYRDAGGLTETLRACGVEVQIPLEGLAIGQQKSWLKSATEAA